MRRADANCAAHRQGKFWPMHDLIFKNQNALNDDRYLAYAGALGLDIEQFQNDRKSREVRLKVLQDAEQAVSLGVSGTPAWFVNGKLLAGALPLEAFQEAIDEALGRG